MSQKPQESRYRVASTVPWPLHSAAPGVVSVLQGVQGMARMSGELPCRQGLQGEGEAEVLGDADAEGEVVGAALRRVGSAGPSHGPCK